MDEDAFPFMYLMPEIQTLIWILFLHDKVKTIDIAARAFAHWCPRSCVLVDPYVRATKVIKDSLKPYFTFIPWMRQVAPESAASDLITWKRLGEPPVLKSYIMSKVRWENEVPMVWPHFSFSNKFNIINEWTMMSESNGRIMWDWPTLTIQYPIYPWGECEFLVQREVYRSIKPYFTVYDILSYVIRFYHTLYSDEEIDTIYKVAHGIEEITKRTKNLTPREKAFTLFDDTRPRKWAGLCGFIMYEIIGRVDVETKERYLTLRLTGKSIGYPRVFGNLMHSNSKNQSARTKNTFFQPTILSINTK